MNSLIQSLGGPWLPVSMQNWLHSSFTDRIVNIYKPAIIFKQPTVAVVYIAHVTLAVKEIELTLWVWPTVSYC